MEISRRRESSRLTVGEAAARAQFTTRQQWNAVESGATKNPTVMTMVSVAHALGCAVEDLVVIHQTQPRRTRRPN